MQPGSPEPKYRVIGRLGRGGMGVVDLAVDHRGRQFALKRLSLHGTPEELAKARQRIHREAEVLLQLDHPAIVNLHEAYDDGDDLVLVMDHLPGGNLASRIATEGPMPSTQIRTMSDRLLDALAAAHRLGIIHRDIKPANVLFDADGRAYLVDFGAATHRDATPGLTATEMVVGTPGFMSPEQARGETATAASDVFSLGATLAFAASGEGPFGTADPRVLMLRAAAGKIDKVPKTLSPDLRRRLEWMLERDPARRPTAAQARGGTDGTNPLPVPTPGPLHRFNTKSWRLAAAALLVAVLGVGTAAWVGTSANNGSPRPNPPVTTSTRATTTTEACVNLPYQPCGQSKPAANTDGTRCLAGFGDYDNEPANGCEVSALEVPPSSELTAKNPITANIVPQDSVVVLKRPVKDNFNLLGDGTLHIRLKPPPEGIFRLTVKDAEGKVLKNGITSNGDELDFALVEPSTFGDDSTTLTVEVSLEKGSTPTAEPFELTTTGQY